MASNSDNSKTPEVIVTNFLEHIRLFQYDKAKDLVDKPKESNKSGANETTIWPTILTTLGQLALAEKSYSSFLYLTPKWFTRKDAKSVYDVVASDCRKIDEYSMRPQAKLSAVAHVCGQLLPYVQLKSEMIDFFSSLHAMNNAKFCDKNELLLKIESVLRASNDKFYHPQLEPLKSAFVNECEVIASLLRADIALSRWSYTDSLLYLQHAHTKLSRLMATVASFASKNSLVKLPFIGTKPSAVPMLYTWLKQYKSAVYSKFTLYFYDVLSKYCPQGDMKPHLSKCSIDYYSKLVAQHKKTDAHLVALILNSEGLEVRGPGYCYQETDPQSLQGKEAFVAIFGYPASLLDIGEQSRQPCLPLFHQTSLLMIMSCKDRQLNQSDKPVDFYDDKGNVLYIVSRIDPTVSLVFIYKSKKSDAVKKEIIQFVQKMSSSLRCTKV